MELNNNLLQIASDNIYNLQDNDIDLIFNNISEQIINSHTQITDLTSMIDFKFDFVEIVNSLIEYDNSKSATENMFLTEIEVGNSYTRIYLYIPTAYLFIEKFNWLACKVIIDNLYDKNITSVRHLRIHLEYPSLGQRVIDNI